MLTGAMLLLGLGLLCCCSVSGLGRPVGQQLGVRSSSFRRASSRVRMSANTPAIAVMVNGMPGPMALEAAKACVDRGFTLLPWGLTGGSGRVSEIDVVGAHKTVRVKLVKGPSFGPEAAQVLSKLKAEHPRLVVVDYTHPSATLGNLEAYVACDCDLVMGTTGGDMAQMAAMQAAAKNSVAVIAPNMAKQIVAVQAALQEMARRFPNSFVDYSLSVRESHQSTKADTSGTAKAIVAHLTALNGQRTFTLEDVVKIRDEAGQLAFGVPREALLGHAFHTYRLTSPDGTVAFELQHNVCGRRVYAEGTADAVAFVDQVRDKKPRSKALFSMIDVLEAGAML